MANFSFLSLVELGKNTIRISLYKKLTTNRPGKVKFYENLKGVEKMLSGIMDYRNSIIKKIINQDKVDPGTFSFLEPGWWALHATTITAAVMLGSMLSKRTGNNR
jgi:hypothetical protein